MDTLTPEKRSWNMSRIGGKNTRPEIAVRSLLHRMGYRFRLKNSLLPGKPDIILPKYKAAIFVHGCFWHRHEGCRFCYTPKSRLEFWNKKFASNVRRDKTVTEQIRQLGWKQIIIWECELKDEDKLASRLHSAMNKLSSHFNRKGTSSNRHRM